MKKVLSIITALCLIFCLAGCGGYSTPTDVITTYFESHNNNDYQAVLNCYPEQARDFFMESEGGEEGFKTMVNTLHNYGTIVYEIVKEEDITDLSQLNLSLEFVGNTFEISAAKKVYLKLYTKHSDGTTTPNDISDLEESVVITVLVDDSWYIFDTLVYSEDTPNE
ncbi:MAG: hypothetical protein IJ462_02115 [Clostridia bacterium]|nr:hypothetical protein [Clostridia bacterium]